MRRRLSEAMVYPRWLVVATEVVIMVFQNNQNKYCMISMVHFLVHIEDLLHVCKHKLLSSSFIVPNCGSSSYIFLDYCFIDMDKYLHFANVWLLLPMRMHVELGR